MRKIFAICVGLAGLFCTATAGFAADPGTEDPNNWPQYNRTANAWRYSPLDQINKDNVSKLSVAWIAHGGDITMGIQETPHRDRWRDLFDHVGKPGGGAGRKDRAADLESMSRGSIR